MGLDASKRIWLVRFNGPSNKTAIFPTNEGKFSGPNITSGAKYRVSAMPNADTTVNNVQDHVPPAQVFSQGYSSPFGSFPLPVASKSQSLPRSAKKNFRKTIIVVSLLKRDVRNQPCSSKTGSLDYNVVSHIVVNLEQSMCNVGSVAQLVKQQLGIEMILLDSKCFKLYDNESTSGMDFWKSSRKILAASKQAYESLTGKSARDTPDALVDKTGEESRPIAKKPRLVHDADANYKLDKVVTGIKTLNDLFHCFPQCLECVVC